MLFIYLFLARGRVDGYDDDDDRSVGKGIVRLEQEAKGAVEI